MVGCSELKEVFTLDVKGAIFLHRGQEERRNKIVFNLFLTLKNSWNCRKTSVEKMAKSSSLAAIPDDGSGGR